MSPSRVIVLKAPWRALLPLAALLAMHAGQVAAAWHDKFPGQEVEVHYVQLTGHDGDNAVNRKLLQIGHGACVDRNKVRGKQAKALSPDDIPAIPRPENVEIYYSANRTLLVVRGQRYEIEKEACALAVFEHHTLRLSSGIGRCDIDLVKKEARGQCDSDMHRSASASPVPLKEQVPFQNIDISNLPPELQKQVRAQIERMKKLPGSGAPSGNASQKGGAKTIAGIKCEVSRYSAVNAEKCIANPASEFVILASPFNAERPGLLLEVSSSAMTLRAQQVILHMRASEDIFSIPSGMKMPSSKKKGA